MRKIYIAVFAVAVTVLQAGCASNNVSRFQMPGTDLNAVQTLRLNPSSEQPRDIELHGQISSQLEQHHAVTIEIKQRIAAEEAGAQ